MNRLSPIPGTLEHIKGYPSTLVVYKTPASRFYWTRFYYNGKNRIKTTKCETLRDAKSFAIEFYKTTLLSPANSITKTRDKAFSVVGSQFFASIESNSNTQTYKVDYARYKQHILPAFKTQPIDTITNAEISHFIAKLSRTGIKPATIKHHIIVLRKVMKFAIANDLMKNLPVFPKITGKLQTSLKRDYLTVEEYDQVIKSAEKLALDKEIVRGIPITIEMKFLIQFIVNSFIRPSDIRVIKHKHINLRNDGNIQWLELTHPATKTNQNAVQAMPVSVFIYQNLMEYRKLHSINRGPDNYVFFPEYENRNTAIQTFARLFNRIIEHTELEVKTDKQITLYSLRHTAIMMRLIIGEVDTLILSRNARTSQAMIDRFYASHLTTEQVRKQLHAFHDRVDPTSKTSSVKKFTPTKKTVKKTSTRKTKTA